MLKEPQFIHLGCGVALGEGSKLLCWSSYDSGKEKQTMSPCLSLGDCVHATRNLVIQCAGKISIGNNVLFASDVFVIDYNHGTSPLSDSYLDNDLDVKEVVIEDGVWIGNSVIVLPGVVVGKKSIIGAGSVVTHSIPPYSIAAGNPARVLKSFDFKSMCWKDVCVKQNV